MSPLSTNQGTVPPARSSPWYRLLRTSYATRLPEPGKGRPSVGGLGRGGTGTPGLQILSLLLGVSGGRRGCTGARHASKASISTACGTVTSDGVSHSGCTTIVAVRSPRRMSLVKARTFLCSGVGFREGRGHKLSAPEHMDVWLWGLQAHHEWWPLPQRQGC